MTTASQPTVRVDGHTKAIGILAYPCHHVRTPAILNASLVERHINAAMLPMQVAPAELAVAVEGLRRIENLAGFVTTVPHKTEMAKLCDSLEGVAAALGVCNVVRRDAKGRLIGCLLDGEGFVAGMRKQQIDPRGMRTLLLGAGGAATAVAAALVGAGVSELTVVNRTSSKAEEAVGLVTSLHPGAPVRVGTTTSGDWDLVVNCTSLGLASTDPLPIPVSDLRSNMVVADVIMQPAKTALLTAAESVGCRIHLGEHMVLAQIDQIIDFLLGK